MPSRPGCSLLVVCAILVVACVVCVAYSSWNVRAGNREARLKKLRRRLVGFSLHRHFHLLNVATRNPPTHPTPHEVIDQVGRPYEIPYDGGVGCVLVDVASCPISHLRSCPSRLSVETTFFLTQRTCTHQQTSNRPPATHRSVDSSSTFIGALCAHRWSTGTRVSTQSSRSLRAVDHCELTSTQRAIGPQHLCPPSQLTHSLVRLHSYQHTIVGLPESDPARFSRDGRRSRYYPAPLPAPSRARVNRARTRLAACIE
jgi:hypothetical protein